MLSTKYRLRLESICKDIASGTEVTLEDMIWANKLAKANTSARGMMSQARRLATDEDGSCLSIWISEIQNQTNQVLMVLMISQTGSKMINQMIGDNVTKKKEEREYAKSREEYFREFHRVIAPVIVMKKYDE